MAENRNQHCPCGSHAIARAVDRSLESYLAKEGAAFSVGVHERIGVCISSNPAAQYLIARAARMA
jgi:K+-sensing histidine kinase KdpD